jgi:hypothetical protein
MKRVHSVTISLSLTLALLLLYCLWDNEAKFLVLWAVHLIPSVFVSAPLWYFCLNRVRRNSFDFLILTVPFLVYLTLGLLWYRPKGIGNLIELLILGCCLPLSPIARAVRGEKGDTANFSAFLLAALYLAAIAPYAFVPTLE